MRKVKFRAKVEGIQQVLNVHTINQVLLHGTTYEAECIGWHDSDPTNQIKFAFDKAKWLQYTGLKDKNGKEIYEGDIVKAVAKKQFVDSDLISDIIRDSKDTAWCVRSRDNKAVYTHGLNLNWWDNLEVIGNIYQDKGLLK